LEQLKRTFHHTQGPDENTPYTAPNASGSKRSQHIINLNAEQNLTQYNTLLHTICCQKVVRENTVPYSRRTNYIRKGLELEIIIAGKFHLIRILTSLPNWTQTKTFETSRSVQKNSSDFVHKKQEILTGAS
jgi:hypothetical protein